MDDQKCALDNPAHRFKNGEWRGCTLGVEKLDPIIVAINADKMNPYRHG